MAGNTAILAWLNTPPANAAKATQALSNTANLRAQVRYNPSPQLKAQIKGQLAAQKQQALAAQQQAKNLNAQQRNQLAAQKQALAGQKQAVDALQRQQRIQQGSERLQQSRERLELGKLQEERLQTNQLASAVEGLTGKAKETGSRLESWAANVKTPGGIGLLLIVIFIFLWAIVPVNGGKTRGQLFWLTLTGRTRMTDTPDAGGTYVDPGATGGTGSGQAPSAASNGHNQSFADVLSNLNIRDFGSSTV